jgi:hypothetical protein
MNVTVDPEAIQELRDAAEWYVGATRSNPAR